MSIKGPAEFAEKYKRPCAYIDAALDEAIIARYPCNVNDLR